MVSNERLSMIDLIMISLGCAFYGLGLVSVNIANHLAEGGVTGITLIIRYWLHIDPALSTILINIPLIIIGYRYLGKKALVYTVYGTLALSFWIWFWQRFYIPINIHNDLFIAGILAGISQLVNFIQGGAYAARGVVIISRFPDEIAKSIIQDLDRGVSYLAGQGAFSNQDFKAIYCVVSPSELTAIKRIAEHHDPKAFISVLDVTEAMGEGFTYNRPKKKLL